MNRTHTIDAQLNKHQNLGGASSEHSVAVNHSYILPKFLAQQLINISLVGQQQPQDVRVPSAQPQSKHTSGNLEVRYAKDKQFGELDSLN